MTILWRVLSFALPVPLWAILILGAWWQFDKHSAVRQAVAELVASSQLEAERAKAHSAQLVSDELRQRTESLTRINRDFEAKLGQANAELETANAEIAELSSRPINDECIVDDSLLGRLRNR